MDLIPFIMTYVALVVVVLVCVGGIHYKPFWIILPPGIGLLCIWAVEAWKLI